MSFIRSAGLISACTLLSRVLGFARDAIASYFFGTSALWDAFALAFRIPNLFRRLFGEGALTSAFLPAFVERLEAAQGCEGASLIGQFGVGFYSAFIVADRVTLLTRVQALERAGLLLDLGLAEPTDVVVDGHPPDVGAGRDGVRRPDKFDRRTAATVRRQLP